MHRLLLPLLFSGCSTQVVEPTACDSNTSCRDAFGLGSVCTDDGTCDTASLHPRCTTVYPETLTLPVDTSTTFVVGTVFDHSLDTHQGRYRSAQLAFKQANENGGLEGRDFAVIHCTNQEDAAFDALDKTAATVDVAAWLADDVGVPAIVGPAASSRSEAVYNEVSDPFGLLIVSPSATSPTLTPLDGTTSTDTAPGLLWRTAPPDDFQAQAISLDMVQNFDAEDPTLRDAPSLDVGVIFQSGAYGAGLEAAFTAAHTGAGGTTAVYPFENDSTRTDAVINAIAAGHDEILFVSSDATDVVAFLQTAASTGDLADIPAIFLTDAARNADVLAVSGEAQDLLARARGTAPASPTGPEYQSFVGAYAAEYNGADVSPLSYTAQSFDAAWMVAYGHAWALAQEGELTGTTIARGFRKLSNGTSHSVRASSWNGIKAELSGGSSIDIVGASGSLNYDATTGETAAAINVWTVNGAGDDFVIATTFDL